MEDIMMVLKWLWNAFIFIIKLDVFIVILSIAILVVLWIYHRMK